jgi:phosphoribosylanthranilate isomerase
MLVKVQIYLRTAKDAAMTAAAGADFIGVVCDPHNLPQVSLDYARARAVLAAVPADRMRVALTASPDVADILQMVEAVKPDVVQLVGDPQLMPPEEVARLRAAMPTVKVMRAIPVGDRQSIDLALTYQAVSDYLILDTHDPGAVDIGATGKTHDWHISAELVRRVHIPVFLAGGLSPDNVAQAIRAVQPWGVDSFSLTNLPGSDGRKDPAKVRAFIANAKSLNH